MARAGYSQFCPVARTAELLAERWMPLVVRELLAGSRHFSEPRRGSLRWQSDRKPWRGGPLIFPSEVPLVAAALRRALEMARERGWTR